MVLIMLPMWMNFLLRTYSWMAILENNGLLNQLFQKIGLISLYNSIFGTDLSYFRMINTQGAVVLGMVYNYLPFMILPLHTTLSGIDKSYAEAAQDLGADKTTVFLKTTLPLSVSGILSGITMVFIPTISTYAISQLLSNGKIFLFGDSIQLSFEQGMYGVGSIMSLVMLVFVLLSNFVMNKFNRNNNAVRRSLW